MVTRSPTRSGSLKSLGRLRASSAKGLFPRRPTEHPSLSSARLQTKVPNRAILHVTLRPSVADFAEPAFAREDAGPYRTVAVLEQ